MTARRLRRLRSRLGRLRRGGPARREPAPDAGVAADAAAPAAVDAASSDGAGPGGSDAGPETVAPDAGAAPAPRVATVSFYGRVLEKGTSKPLAGAALSHRRVAAGETDGDGRFSLAVPGGAHDLAIKVAGQEVVHQPIVLVPGVEGTEQNLPRAHPRQPRALRDHRARRPPRDPQGRGHRRGGAPDGGQLGRSAADHRLAPGRRLRSPGRPSLYVVRGANPGNTGFFLDGIRVPELFHLGLELSVINPYLIEGVEFYPGGSPANYGPYVSGIMAARTARAAVRSRARLRRRHAVRRGRDRDLSLGRRARHRRGGGALLVHGRAVLALQNSTVLRYGDYQLRVDHPLGGGQATLFAFGALDDVGFTNAAANPEYGSLQFHRLDLRWRRGLAGGRLLVGATAGADWSNSTLFESLIKVRALSAAPRLIYTHPLGRPVDLEVGGEREPADLRHRRPQLPAQAERSRTIAPGALRGGLYDADLPRRRSPDRLARAAHRSRSPSRGPPRSSSSRASTFSSTSRTRWRCGPTAAGTRRCPACRSACLGSRRSGWPTTERRPPSAARWAPRCKLPAHLTLGVTGFYQKLRLTDVRNIDIESNDPTAPDFLVTRDGRAYGAELSSAAPTWGASTAGSPTRSPGASATTTTACSAARTGTSGTS